MRETFTRYLGKLVENTKGLLTHSSAEQTTQKKETVADSLQGKLATPQGTADRPAHLVVEKSKKRRIPFIALALVLIFTSLCVISLVGWPVTLAVSANPSSATLHHSKSLHLDPDPPPDGPPAGTPTQYQPDPLDVPFFSPCTDHYQSYGTFNSDGTVKATNTVCWDKSDFQWANADLSCLVNPKYPKGILNTSSSGSAVPSPTPGGTFAFTWSGHNQNTCVDNHTCFSNDASQQDSDGTIHDEVLGDDITCWNEACYGTNNATPSSSSGNAAPYGVGTISDECGSGEPYDKFACQAYGQGTGAVLDPQLQGVLGIGGAGNPLESGEFELFVNPTAFNPLGYAEIAAKNLSMPDGNANGQTIDASGDQPVCGTGGYWSCSNGDKVNLVMNEGTNLMVDDFDESKSPIEINSDSFLYGSAGAGQIPYAQAMPLGYTVACNHITSGWAFPCSDTNSGSSQPFMDYSSGISLDEGQVNAAFIATDWLSGNANPSLDAESNVKGTSADGLPGHLEYTYLSDTVDQSGVKQLEGFSELIGFILIVPTIILIGYQLLWASWVLGRATALESFGRIILSASAIALSFSLAAVLIKLADTINLGVVAFHKELGYPNVNIGGQASTFTLIPQGENDPSSFRGVVVPISRWGCIANDFVGLLSSQFWTDVMQFIPFVGGAIQFAGKISNAIDFAHHAGEFIVLLLSIDLCTQVFIRIVLLNYYVLTGPLAFGCWGLPGGVGGRVVTSWMKGFCSLLLAQTVQILVLTTFPLILPDFPSLPSDKFGVLSMVFEVLPRVLVLSVTIKVPSVMGTGATKAMAQAGAVVAGAVAAAGGAAMNVV